MNCNNCNRKAVMMIFEICRMGLPGKDSLEERDYIQELARAALASEHDAVALAEKYLNEIGLIKGEA